MGEGGIGDKYFCKKLRYISFLISIAEYVTIIPDVCKSLWKILYQLLTIKKVCTTIIFRFGLTKKC